tara:strand:+ start:558 stop:809 length:252 start_codon:yes stop_codon:yes gene_type:complete
MKIKKKNIKTISKKIVELDNNPVREYLKENSSKKLSVKTLRNNLSIKKRKVLFYCQNSKYIRQVAPREVGSYKYSLDVFTYVQ